MQSQTKNFTFPVLFSWETRELFFFPVGSKCSNALSYVFLTFALTMGWVRVRLYKDEYYLQRKIYFFQATVASSQSGEKDLT